jgi:hypothetical protein
LRHTQMPRLGLLATENSMTKAHSIEPQNFNPDIMSCLLKKILVYSWEIADCSGWCQFFLTPLVDCHHWQKERQ